MPAATARTLSAMPQPGPASLEFGNTVIDFAGHRLLRDGREQPLEPKAFGVLALLASSPGRVFSRDEILDAVWGHHHVTPGVLNRIMTLLRQALGEDAQHPRLLHTVHGVGYRFDPPEADAAGDSGHDAATAPTPRDNTVADATRVRRRRALATAAFVLLGLIAVTAWRLWPDAPAIAAKDPARAAATLPDEVTALAVVPLRAIGPDEGTRVIAEGLSEELIGSLARIEGMRVIARTSSFLAAAESGDPAQLAQRLGVSHLLEGSLQRDGEALRARLRLLDAHGRTLWARDFDRDATEVLLLQREVAEAVAASLALRLALPRPAGGGGGDARFLRRYHAARALVNLRTPVEQSVELAESEFRALLHERPEDARVHAGLALALEVRAQRKPTLAPGLRSEALREADIAIRLDPELPEPYYIRGHSACMRGEWERCLELMADVSRLRPGEVDASAPLAAAMSRLGYLDRAEAVLSGVVERDPLNAGAHFLLGRQLDTLGRHGEARVHLQQAGMSGAYARWFNAVWRKDHDEALRIAGSEIGSPGFADAYGARYAPGYIAASRALRDPSLWPETLARLEQSERDSGIWNFVRVLSPDAPRHAPEYIGRLDEIRQRGYSSWDLLLWTKDLAWLRRDPAFQDHLRESGILDYWRAHGFPEQCRPLGEGAVCE